MDDVNRPHIVLIVADQLTWWAVEAAKAPNLRHLAGEALVYERAYCPSPLCVPSRMAFMSGLLPSQTGAFDNAGELPAGVPTFAHRRRLEGYRTVLAGKMHFIGPDQLHGFEERPLTDTYPAGFDWIPDWRLEDDERLPWYHDLGSVLGAGPVTSTLQTDYDAEAMRCALEVLESHDYSAQPLLLVVSLNHPHDPYEVPHEHWDRYEGVDIPAPRRPGARDDPSTRRLRAMLESDRIAVSDEQVLRARRGYLAAVSLVDDYVGQVLEAAPEDAIVVFTSDHGDMLGERGLWYKMAPFEESIRVPLIVRAPGVAPQRVSRPVSLLDLGLAPVLPERDVVPVEYLAEGVRSPQVVLVRDDVKLVRTLGEPDLFYDPDDEPVDPDSRLAAAADAMWDLDELDARVRSSQEQRRIVAEALRLGRVTTWDIPGGYISTGDDFWTQIQRARRP